MKKILALVAVVALVAFAAPAFANVNPFMDVPMNHWAYDAIGQLAARGVLSGYPDGTYKGNQPMTRYEAASAVARALAVVDMTKASKQDVEMLKRLVVEFKDELDALGVKVDKIDSRLAVIEERLGGWKLWGEFRFDAKFGGNDNMTDPALYGTSGANQFNISRYRIWMRKYIDDKVTFTARIRENRRDNATRTERGLAFDRYYIDVKFPWDITATIGMSLHDWEGEDGLYVDNDAMFTDRSYRGFYFNKPFAMGNFAFYVSRPDEIGAADGTAEPGFRSPIEHYEIGARAKFNFNEQLWLSLNGIMRKYDSNVLTSLNGAGVEKEDEHVYWAAAGVNFTPSIALKAAYYGQEVQVGDTVGTETPKSFQAIVDVKQDALKFTSLWAEYRSFDENFKAWTDGPWDNYGAAVTGTNLGALYDNAIFFKLNQKWTDQWSTFQRYLIANARNEIAGVSDNTTNWTFGVKYNYTPGLSFELVYDKIENAQTVVNNDDSLIRFRTHIAF